MPSRWPPQRSEDQTSRGCLPKPIKNSTWHIANGHIAYGKWNKAEDMMPVRKPPQRSEDQLPNGHMSEPIIKQQIAYSLWHMANRDQRLEIRH